jgi:isoquinoline 1-oxidoreductase beta subunit
MSTIAIPTPTENETKPIGRRGFLGAAGGLTVGFFLPGFYRFGEAAPAVTTTSVNAWITIGSDESIVITVGAAEMGQGSTTGLAQIVAEELMVNWTNVSIVQAPASLAYVTAGSSTTRLHYAPLRLAGATARETLILAAMNALGDATRANYTAANGIVTNTVFNKSLKYGQLALAASKLPPVSNPPLTPDAQFQLIGQTIPRFDIPSKTDGSAIYGIDVRIPGMVYAVVKHCPTFGGTLASTPRTPSGALAVVPLKVTVPRGADLLNNINAVAVVGPNTWDTWQMARSLQVTWNIPAASASIDSTLYMAQAQQMATAAAASLPAGTLFNAESAGDVVGGFTGAAKVLDAVYTLPYVAHACMEVLNCTVNLSATSCEIWAPTQLAGVADGAVSTLTGLATSAIKAEVDFVNQAVMIAQAVKKPVKLMWPREEVHARSIPTHGRDSRQERAGSCRERIGPAVSQRVSFDHDAARRSASPDRRRKRHRRLHRAPLRFRIASHRVRRASGAGAGR